MIVTAFFAVLGLSLAYVWKRLVWDPRWSRRVRFLLSAALAALLSAMVRACSADFEPATQHFTPLQRLGLLFGGWLFYLVVLFLAVDLARAVRWVGSRLRAAEDRRSPSGDSAGDSAATLLTRRALFARAAAGGVAAVSGAIVARGHRNVWEATLPEIPVRLERLPRALDGFRIVQLTDVHLGHLVGGDFLARVVALANERKPDVVVITGDFIEGRVDTMARELEPLRKLRARHGVYFTTGNHEYYSEDGPELWLPVLETFGVRPLINQRVSVGDASPGGASFDLVGLPDRRGGRYLASHAPNLARALARRDVERELIVLAHQPGQIEEVEGHGASLQISGHTHGGQLFPFGAFVRLVEPYVAGLARHRDGTQVYVSRGAGFWGTPVRVLAPSEIPTLVLTT